MSKALLRNLKYKEICCLLCFTLVLPCQLTVASDADAYIAKNNIKNRRGVTPSKGKVEWGIEQPSLNDLPILLGAKNSTASNTNLNLARETIREWVEVRSIISKERNEWEIEKSYLNDLALLLEAEKSTLQEQLASISSTRTKADKERLDLLNEKDEIEKSHAAITETVTGYIHQLKTLSSFLPDPLKEKSSDYFTLALKSESEPLEDTINNLIKMVYEIEQFDNKVNLGNKVLTLSINEKKVQREVKVVFIGLGQAFYVDYDANLAGYGYPTTQGWVWVENNALKEKVNAAVNLYLGRKNPSLIEMPIIIGTL